MLLITEILMLGLIILSPFSIMEFDFSNNLHPIEFFNSMDTIEDSLDSILNIAESYGVDKSNRESYILAAILRTRGTISRYFSMLPFIDDKEGSDITLTLRDTLCSRVLLSLLFFPTFAYSTICNSVTWQVPSLFFLFLPALKILRKTLRSFNTSLRIVSNTTASHLLILLLTAAVELSYTNRPKILTILISIITSIVIILEIVVSALQEYIFTALLLYYTHTNE